MRQSSDETESVVESTEIEQRSSEQNRIFSDQSFGIYLMIMIEGEREEDGLSSVHGA